MDKKELRKLSKNQLIELLFAERSARLDLEQRFHELECRFKAYENPHTPSSQRRKKNTDHNKNRFPGKPPGSSGGGLELPPPDRTEEHSLDSCPKCDSALSAPVCFRKFITLDLPEKPIEAVEHRSSFYWCEICNTSIESDRPNYHYGPRLCSLTLMLKNLTNSHQKIADLMQEIGAPSFSSAQVQEIGDRYSKHLAPQRDEIHRQILKEPFLHIDETGFRRDGKNGYVWGIFTPKFALLQAVMSRARKVKNALLGKYNGVVVSDGYAAYDDCEKRQRCWVHLLRELKESAEDDPELTVQYERAKTLFGVLKNLPRPVPEEIIHKQVRILNDIVTCLNVVHRGKKAAVLIENGGEEWFTALRYVDVPLDNNAAERGLRHIVLHRKMIGCYRNDKGQNFINNVISTFQTWKLQGKNIFQSLIVLPC